VQADRFDHFGNEVIDQPSGPELLVFVIDIVIGSIFREIVQHVPDGMQQACRDQLSRCTGLFGSVRRLECMLLLRHRFLAVVARTALAETIQHMRDRIIDCSAHERFVIECETSVH
jgi:hypothetical protein